MQKVKDDQQVISYNYNNLAAETLNHRNTMEDVRGMVNQIGENVDAASNLSAAFSRDEDRQ
jgi:hypothetical protein